MGWEETPFHVRARQVFKGFDEKRGVDIAWSRIPATVTDPPLDDEAMEKITAEMSKGLALEHPNIIRCYRSFLLPSLQ